MKSTYPQVSSPVATNGHATEWQLQQAIAHIERLEEMHASEKRRADEWRQLFIMATALSAFLVGLFLWRMF